MSVIDNNRDKVFDFKNFNTCPIKMSDGRIFTNYESRCLRNAYLNNLLTENKMTNSSYEQRLFLQNNYEKIVEAEMKQVLFNITPCIPCKEGELLNETDSYLDNKHFVYCDNVSCSTQKTNQNGLGTTKSF